MRSVKQYCRRSVKFRWIIKWSECSFFPGTFTVAALNYARTDAFAPAFGDRAGVRNLVVFVTDGVSFDSVDLGNGLTTLDIAAGLLHQVADVSRNLFCFADKEILFDQYSPARLQLSLLIDLFLIIKMWSVLCRT